ncbi:MAG: TolC family protein [Candidatus Eremiobacteraeota bacterium]|nr:TolC family protein [Candidatus Eremiobacteraeota bacterium]
MTPALAAAVLAATLDLPHAVGYALAHDPTLLARRAQVAQAESNWASLHAAQFPSINGLLESQLGKSANATGSLAQYGITQLSQYSLNTAQVSSVYNLWNGGLAQLQAQQAKRQMESARADLQHAEDQKAVDVATSYFALANKRVGVRLSQSDVLYQQELLAIARANERVGRGAAVDVLRAESSEARGESALVSAQADAANASESLAQTIGAPLDTAFAIPEPLPEPALPATPLERMIAVAESLRPDVASAKAQLLAAILADRQIDTNRFPQFQLTAAFGSQFSPTAYGSNLASIEQQNALNAQLGLPLLPLPPRGSPGFWQIGATSSLGFPLIDWGTRHAEHRAARAQIDSATANLDGSKRTVELDVRQSLRSAQGAAASLQYAKVAASAGAESARIAQLQYKNGLISIADVNSAQQQSLSSEIDLQNSRANYLTALVKLRVALGTFDPVRAVTFENGR